ncbi:2-keto-4-pentenoate hydratase [Marinobacterium sp. LSUCC0821]|uniref:2-keto-4-pentenoate hydratase n=1 Tax=Marinobacterium sp. LSUCC0821 TaxID=2668067 RepID=UPI0014514086|nr:fumarylacetoacetate hydrolase family protein [Marinobacterium sp. LSUCC0821]QJD71995.1 hydratase [Marinobacterium sp. LSUCC0821]
MQIESAKAASQLLVRHWKEGLVLDALPPALRPATRAEGYLIQSQIETISTSPLFGWKIAATSSAGQQHIGVEGPIVGRLLTEMVHTGDATLHLGANRMRVAEAEFAFRMGRDLPPRDRPYDQSEVFEAVAALYLAIEIPDSRFANYAGVGGPQLIADNACAHRFVLGPQAPVSWRSLDLSTHRVVGRVGNRMEREGLGANVLGDPRQALTWCANELSTLGITLAAQQTVTTGTCLVPLEVRPGDSVSVDFGMLGQVGCHFAAD